MRLQCPACERELAPGALFCDACGARVTPPRHATPAETPAQRRPRRDVQAYTPRHLADRILTSRSAFEGERKHVTVLFADLADSTPLSQRLDPEEMHQLMDRCFQSMLEAVHRYEGTVNQFTGDGIMALFGAPIALEAASHRAVTAALAIQQALAPLDQEVQARWGVGFRMRIGIHSGLVVVGRIGDDLRMDYTAVGDTTNLASRLQQIAPAGGVVVSASTERMVSGFFAVEALPEAQLKGFAEPVHAYRVLGERSVEGRLEASVESGLTSFVGRTRELETLVAAFESASRGRGQVVFLVGEAGIGKSRLRYEFRRRLGDTPYTWVEGRCASNTIDTAFHPIVDGLRRSLGLEDGDDDATAVAKLEQHERDAGGDLEWTLPLLRQLLSLPVGDATVEEMDPATRRSETCRALHARFLRASQLQPLILVVEDLHWIDTESEEFLSFLSDSIPASRFLLLFTARPGYQHTFGDRSYHVRVTLQSLSGEEMAEMAGAMLSSANVPRELHQLIASKAEGNPFFVEEVTKSLLEQGALRLEGGDVILKRNIADISVPDSIQDVLMARIDRLDEEPKRAIQIASVIGREFTLRLLERISETGTRLTGVVSDLRALELLVEKGAHPELAFMFKHALTHDVAYSSILLQRRKTIHEFVGRAIEELYRDRLPEHYEALAHHFSLGEVWNQALLYHEKASAKALDAYANHAAAEHSRRALEIADRLAEGPGDERRRLLAERLALTCWLVSEFKAAGEAYRRAAGYSGEPAQRAVNLCLASYALHWAHDYASARELCAEALSLARSHDQPLAEGLALVVEAFDGLTSRGDVEGLDEQTTKAISLAGSNEELRGFALMHKGQVAEWRGDYQGALAIEGESLQIARRLRRPDIMIHSSWFLGKANCCLGRYGQALAQFQGGIDLADRIGDRAWTTRLLNTLGWCFAEFGCHERATEFNQRSTILAGRMVELDLVPGAPELHGNAAINLTCNRIALGDLDGALEQIEPVQNHAESETDPWMRWRYELHLCDALARLQLARGEPEAALVLLSREMEGARRHGAKKIEARALELQGRALATLDRRRDARVALRGALEIGQRIGYPPVLWRSHSMLAELARRDGESQVAAQHAAQTKQLIEGLAASLPEAALQRAFRGLGERLLTDALGSYA